MADINESLNSMKGTGQLEKDLIQKIRDIKAQIEEAGVEEQQAERAGDLSKVAEIRYGRNCRAGKTDDWLKTNGWPRSSRTAKCSKKKWMRKMLQVLLPSGPASRWTTCCHLKRKNWSMPKNSWQKRLVGQS